MTEKEMVDFVVNHARVVPDEAIREQVRKCWELIVVRGRQLEKNAVHVVVPEERADAAADAGCASCKD